MSMNIGIQFFGGRGSGGGGSARGGGGGGNSKAQASINAVLPHQNSDGSLNRESHEVSYETRVSTITTALDSVSEGTLVRFEYNNGNRSISWRKTDRGYVRLGYDYAEKAQSVARRVASTAESEYGNSRIVLLKRK